MTWRIRLAPSAALPGDDTRLTASIAGDTITINGGLLDLSALEEGDTLPGEAVDHPLVIGTIARVLGEIRISLLFPIGHPAPDEARFPADIVMLEDGNVPLPAPMIVPISPGSGPT